MQRSHSPSDDSLPVSEALFARIIRAQPHELRDLTAGLSDGGRARLALFCNVRSHMRAVAHALASGCSEDCLVREGGQAGRSLFAQARAETTDASPSGRPGTKPVTLARLAQSGSRPSL